MPVVFLPGASAPEAWVWETLRANPYASAGELGGEVAQLSGQISRLDSIYDSASDSLSNITKTKLRELARSLEWGVADVCRVVARKETERRESDIQPLVEGLENALLQWRAA